MISGLRELLQSSKVDVELDQLQTEMDQLPPDLASLVAREVLACYESLPSNGKPRMRSNGAVEWTVLAGFCLCQRREPQQDEQHIVRCISLGWVRNIHSRGEGLYENAVLT